MPSCAVKFYRAEQRASDHAFSLRTDRKSALSGINFNVRLGRRHSLERHKSAGLNLNAAQRRLNLLFGTRRRRAAILKFRDLKSARLGLIAAQQAVFVE